MHYKITTFGGCAPYPRLIYWIASSISQGFGVIEFLWILHLFSLFHVSFILKIWCWKGFVVQYKWCRICKERPSWVICIALGTCPVLWHEDWVSSTVFCSTCCSVSTCHSPSFIFIMIQITNTIIVIVSVRIIPSLLAKDAQFISSCPLTNRRPIEILHRRSNHT
jgi:hypothetical protein